MEKYTPTENLLKIQKMKYKEAIIPILLVFSGFAINYINPYSFVKFMSLLGLIGFLFISLKYRIKKNIPPEGNDCYSPVYGVIKEVDRDDGKIIINKRFFSPADFRCVFTDQNIDLHVQKGKLTLFESNCSLPGKLIGILPLSALITCKIPLEYEITVNTDQSVIAGETIIAIKKTANEN
jgi:hypothetical protein